MKTKMKSKYPPYPGSGYDYSVREIAKMVLEKPNKKICIYCHAQCEKGDIPHKEDCPAKGEQA